MRARGPGTAGEERNPTYDRIHEEAFAVERVHFKKTKKRTSPKKVNPFLELPGRIPVLVAAPHSVRWMRQGKVHPSAEFTGGLAFLLHREVGCHVLAVKKLYGGDPEWDEPCLFKARTGQIVRESGVRAVLTLRGAPRDGGFDVALRQTARSGHTGSERVSVLLGAKLVAEGVGQVVKRIDPANGDRTVTRHCAETLSIPAVQIEINHRFRAPNRNGSDFRSLFRALAGAISELGGPV